MRNGATCTAFAARIAMLCGIFLLSATGCKKTIDYTSGFTGAINSYYDAHPACLWSQPKKFPEQADTSGSAKTTALDALVDQGLLVRTTAEKRKMIVASKQVNNYDLSDKGRSAWTADVQQPGYGNFCYGHRKVSSIDSSTPTDGATGSTTVVSYHYTVNGAPAWASAAETENAYPQVRADLSGPQEDQATLTSTGNNGWQVTSVRQMHPSSGTDGKIVE